MPVPVHRQCCVPTCLPTRLIPGAWCWVRVSTAYYLPALLAIWRAVTPDAVVRSAIALAAGKALVAENPAQLARLERARLGVYYVLMLRWDEMYAYTLKQDLAWPIEHPLDAAYQHFATVANQTAVVLRGYFEYEAYVVPVGFVGRFAIWPFGQPKGKTTAEGPIPYLTWLKQQFAWRTGVKGSDAWCQPGYNSYKSAPCWQNCAKVFSCANSCDSKQSCRAPRYHTATTPYCNLASPADC